MVVRRAWQNMQTKNISWLKLQTKISLLSFELINVIKWEANPFWLLCWIFHTVRSNSKPFHYKNLILCSTSQVSIYVSSYGKSLKRILSIYCLNSKKQRKCKFLVYFFAFNNSICHLDLFQVNYISRNKGICIIVVSMITYIICS